MKKIIPYTLIGLLLTALYGHAQAQQQNSELVKKTEVFGSAEKEITPDEIYFSITLKEYIDEDKDKMGIDKLEQKLYNAVRKIDIPEEDFQIQNVFGYNYDRYWRDKKKERNDFLAQKQYRIKFTELNKINRLFEYLDPKSIQNANVSGFSHSRIEQYQSELKIEALRNASEKARTLLAGIGEEKGEVLQIQEIGQNSRPPTLYREARGMAMNEMMEADMAASPNIDFQKIKIKSEVRAVFRIL